MKKTAGFIILGGILGLIVSFVVIVELSAYFKYLDNLKIQGALNAVNSIIAVAEKDGYVIFENTNPKTGEKKSVKLILEKPVIENVTTKK